jgi:hypothetical protein
MICLAHEMADRLVSADKVPGIPAVALEVVVPPDAGFVDPVPLLVVVEDPPPPPPHAANNAAATERVVNNAILFFMLVPVIKVKVVRFIGAFAPFPTVPPRVFASAPDNRSAKSPKAFVPEAELNTVTEVRA